jgi:hypothetical protein
MLAANNRRRDCVGDFCFGAYGTAGLSTIIQALDSNPRRALLHPKEPGELENTDRLVVKTTACYGEGGFTKSLG